MNDNLSTEKKLEKIKPIKENFIKSNKRLKLCNIILLSLIAILLITIALLLYAFIKTLKINLKII